MFPCSLCSEGTIFYDADSFISHFKLKHSVDILEGRMVCNYVGCVGRKFGLFNSFYKHVKTHKAAKSSENVTNGATQAKVSSCANQLNESNQVNESNQLNNESQVSISDSIITSDSMDCSLSEHNDTVDSVNFDEALTHSVVSFLASLYDTGSFTESQIQLIIDSYKILLGSGFLSMLKNEVMNLLNLSVAANLVPADKVKYVSRLFDSCENVFQGFETHHLRMQEFKASGAYVAPEPFVIGQSRDEVNDNGFIVVEPIPLIGQFIPFRKVLKGFLELPGVLKSILDYMSHLDNTYSESGPIENIVQGDLWRKKIKPKFEGKTVLPLKFSFDDYETNKELGYHTGVHKLGAGYIQIATIPPKFASLLENIFLAVLFHSGDRAAGNEKVFRKVIYELKDLEEIGITVVTREGIFLLYFALCLVIGDNLGSNGILGFVESFSANIFCRICFETKAITMYQTESNPSKRRTCSSYDKDLRTDNPSLTGRKGPCVFNSLKSFHVSENVYLDQMHDLDEGVSKYVMYQIIKYFLDKKRYSVEQLNDLVQGFYYGHGEIKNKMPYISSDDLNVNKKIRCSASEMRCLVRYFGLMVGHLVEADDLEVWNLYLLHRKILDIMSAPVVRREDCVTIKMLIKEHHSEYLRIFKTTLKPKFHMLLHEDEILLANGPQEPLSCYRTEHKHKEGGDVARRSNNRINLPFTIAKSHQMKLAFRLICGRGFEPKFSYNIVKTLPVENVPNYSKFKQCIPPGHSCMWNTTKCLEVNGAKYGIGSVVLHSINIDVPVFAQLETINICHGQEAFFLLKKLNVIKFDTHFHAYEVTIGSEYIYVNMNNLLSHISTEIHHKRSKMFVPFRFNIACLKD